MLLRLPPRIERTCPPECLENNARENRRTNIDQNRSAWARGYCKEHSWTSNYSSEIEIAGIKSRFVDWRSGTRGGFRAGVFSFHASGRSGHSVSRHGDLGGLRDCAY